MSIAYYNKTVQEVAEEIVAEASRASALFPPMNSPHEASAVIREEFDEYWDEVKKHNTSKPDRDTRPRQREELIQLAAMCIRAITDTIDIKPVKYAAIYNAPGFGASTQAAIDAAQESLWDVQQGE